MLREKGLRWAGVAAARAALVMGLAWLPFAPLAMAGETADAPERDAPWEGLPYPLAGRPAPGDILHVPTGLPMSFDGMMDMVAGARLVFIGETHDNLRAHEVQLQVIRDLQRRFPGRIALGMEMFRQPQQDALDRWTRGELDEGAFLEAVDWQKTWRIDFGYYRAILEFARDQRLDVVALNPPRELQDQVRRLGLDALPDDLRQQLPEMGPPDPHQVALLKAYYGGHLPTAGAFDAFSRIQLLWEESMADRIVGYLSSEQGEGKMMVVLTGSGHVEYGFGVPKKVLRRMPLPYVIVAPSEIETPPEKQMPGVVPPELPLLPADFIWWVPYVEIDGG